MANVSITDSAAKDILLSNINAKITESLSQKFLVNDDQTKTKSAFLDFDTLTKLKNGEYGITLEQYTTLNTYKSKMSALYGDKSASPLKNYLTNLLETNDEKMANAKNFIEKMEENGISGKDANKIYTALQKYSLTNSLGNYNFVNASV